jgi:polysaccharide export outer membrane protein
MPLSSPRRVARWLVALGLLLGALAASAGIAQGAANDYRLGAGDAIRVAVFQNPELTLETRVSESGAISFPLVGAVAIGGKSIAEAEQAIAGALREGGFVRAPQVTIALIQVRGSQVSVLGQVLRPGRYPLETTNSTVSDLLATAGGIAPGGADLVILTGRRNGEPIRVAIDVPLMLREGRFDQDFPVQAGDILFVDRAPIFYIHGDVARPGSYRVERGMTVRQALAQAGGITLRGTLRGLRLHRVQEAGTTVVSEPEQDFRLAPDDVIFVRESLF